jgi:hypothetical protein
MWQDPTLCGDCVLQNQLHCHTQVRNTVIMGTGFGAILLPFLMGLVATGLPLGTLLILVGGWIGFMIFFFGVWEQAILCRHCPYYAEDARSLHCFDKWGIPKTFTYTPTPVSTGEHIQFLIGSGILLGYPPLILFIWAQPIYGIITVGGVGVWFLLLNIQICPQCVNFGCLFNRVPAAVKAQYAAKGSPECLSMTKDLPGMSE